MGRSSGKDREGATDRHCLNRQREFSDINNLNGSFTTTQAARQAVKAASADQSTKEDALDQLISQVASYVESVAGANEALINSAGMDTKAPASAPSMPDMPTGLEATIGDHDGELDLSWDPARAAM